jgi:ribonuclease BN (tRNA processing enzyme)
MKLQALSTTESEIYACTEAIKDAAYMKTHLASLKVRDNVPIPVHEDNSACITMGMSYLKSYSKARHYVTRLNFLQERVHDETVELIPTPTKEQVADVMTKSLAFDDFQRFRDVLVHDVIGASDGVKEDVTVRINLFIALEGGDFNRKPFLEMFQDD